MSYRTFYSIEFFNPFNAVENQLKKQQRIDHFLLCHTHTHSHISLQESCLHTARVRVKEKERMIGSARMKLRNQYAEHFSNIMYDIFF